MVSAGIQSEKLLCGGAKNFNNSTYCLGLSYQTTYTFACDVLGLACQTFGWSNTLDSRTKVWCTALMWSADIGIS